MFILFNQRKNQIIFPFIFKIFIIPKIESRIGEDFKYIGPLYGGMAFSSWIAPPADISGAIVSKYLFWKITGKKTRKILKEKILKRRHPNCPFVLMQLYYDITKAPILEIIISFVTLMNNLFTMLLLVLICIYSIN